MARTAPDLSGYVEVKDRIEEFYKEFPQGSIQSEIVELTENLVIVKAMAFRQPDDERPGVGHSQMPIPGKTPYTRDSEIENAETSAWGRAIAALGFKVHNSVASADEVKMKAGSDDPTGPVEDTSTDSSAKVGGSLRPATPAQKRMVMTRGKKLLGSEDDVRAFVRENVGVYKSADLTMDQVNVLVEAFDALEAERVNATLDALDAAGDPDIAEVEDAGDE